MKKLLNVMIDVEVIAKVKSLVKNSAGVYRNQSHFVERAIREKIDRENAIKETLEIAALKSKNK